MTLYVLRHCQTDWNLEKKVQGNIDIPLNKNGIKQAEDIRDTISLDGIDFCITSPMIRTKQTANIICEDIVPIYESKLIKERDFGDYEGKKADISDIKRQWNFKYDDGYNNIETLDHLFKRAETFLSSLADNYADKNILVVTHGGFLKALYYVYNGYDYDTDLLSFSPENGKVYEFNIPIRTNILKK